MIIGNYNMFAYSDSSNYIRTILEKNLYNNAHLDLSGWNNSLIFSKPDVHLKIEDKYLRSYLYDEENYLEEKKKLILNHLKIRENSVIDHNQILLAPGATSSISLILHFLKNKIDILIIDAPFYFSIIEVCKILDIPYTVTVKTINTLDNNSLIQLLEKYKHLNIGLFITQPKYIISNSHELSYLKYLYDTYFSKKNYFIIDQSIDLIYKNSDNFIDISKRNFIKIRTIGKNISHYGSRLSLVISHKDTIEKLFIYSDFLYGSIDIGMIELGLILINDENKYNTYLISQSKLLNEKINEIRAMTIGTDIDFFYGNASNLAYLKVNFLKRKRYEMYNFFIKENIHGIFASQFGLKQSFTHEGIRVNLLLDTNDAMEKIINFFR